MLDSRSTKDPVEQILATKEDMMQRWSWWRHIIHVVATLLTSYSVNLSLLFAFIAGSCVEHMDAIHAFVLILFVWFFFSPAHVVRSRWWILTTVIALLTMYEVVVTFVLSLVDVPVDLFLSVRSTTVGVVSLPSRWTAFVYFTVLFFVSAQHQLLLGEIQTWETMYVIFEWRLLFGPEARTFADGG